MLVVGFSPGQEPIDESTLVSKDGLYYAPGSDKPYSGESVLYYESGQKMSEGTWKDGKEDGLWTGWYENGQKMLEGTYKDGESAGKWTYWHSNGQKSWEETYKDGGLIEETWWDEDGNEF
jgi:antitoxin component YwqK of YwqJK toxin-antitoxin module